MPVSLRPSPRRRRSAAAGLGRLYRSTAEAPFRRPPRRRLLLLSSRRRGRRRPPFPLLLNLSPRWRHYRQFLPLLRGGEREPLLHGGDGGPPLPLPPLAGGILPLPPVASPLRYRFHRFRPRLPSRYGPFLPPLPLALPAQLPLVRPIGETPPLFLSRLRLQLHRFRRRLAAAAEANLDRPLPLALLGGATPWAKRVGRRRPFGGGGFTIFFHPLRLFLPHSRSLPAAPSRPRHPRLRLRLRSLRQWAHRLLLHRRWRMLGLPPLAILPPLRHPPLPLAGRLLPLPLRLPLAPRRCRSGSLATHLCPLPPAAFPPLRPKPSHAPVG